jgi:hypothetical protein
VKVAIFEYIEVFYNRRRGHSALDYRTPLQSIISMASELAAYRSDPFDFKDTWVACIVFLALNYFS